MWAKTLRERESSYWLLIRCCQQRLFNDKNISPRNFHLVETYWEYRQTYMCSVKCSCSYKNVDWFPNYVRKGPRILQYSILVYLMGWRKSRYSIRTELEGWRKSQYSIKILGYSILFKTVGWSLNYNWKLICSSDNVTKVDVVLNDR